MILISDSGSTKTLWALIQDGKQEKMIQTQGLNPYFTPPEMMQDIIHNELIHKILSDNITQIYFYGAGCSTDKNNNLIRNQLHHFFREAHIEVFHDILGAGRALFGRKQGIACILGTGCNSCFFDGKDVFPRIPSLGYLYGDEGAGSYLGKEFLGKYLKNELPEQIKTAFDNKYHYTLEDILNSLYNKPFPNRFLAAFSLFLKDHIEDQYIHDLIYFSFLEFIQTHIIKYDHYTSLPIGFIGSIAYQYQGILHEAAQSHSLVPEKILQTPLEGLVEYHASGQ
ncbi:MAG: ATPase [Bacteroidales bacterium]|nr:ATPase [Bacteroidales bacterium]